MTYCSATGILESRPNTRAMQLIDELFMFLVRIRLGLFQQDLAHHFNLHISTVLLGNQVIWPSRADIDAKMSEEFKRLYPTTHIILYCTKIFVETPSSLLLQSQLYSTHKSDTTLKGLVGIAPNGAVTFVSSIFTGTISDKEITRCSGVLENGDSVMADKRSPKYKNLQNCEYTWKGQSEGSKNTISLTQMFHCPCWAQLIKYTQLYVC